MVRSNTSSPTLPSRRVGNPSLWRAMPVLDTAPPVDSRAGPTSTSCPGRSTFTGPLCRVNSGITSRQMCPATAMVRSPSIPTVPPQTTRIARAKASNCPACPAAAALAPG